MWPHVASGLALVVFIILAAGSSDTNTSSPRDNTPSASPSAGPARSAGEDVRVTAAALFTSRYSRSQLARWNVRGQAAGVDCGVLLITIGTPMDETMIESIHHSSSVYTGGVEHFYRERSFRAVVYNDSTGQLWRYGLVSESEARSLNPC
jgi:hypothetical protein